MSRYNGFLSGPVASPDAGLFNADAIARRFFHLRLERLTHAVLPARIEIAPVTTTLVVEPAVT